MARGIVLGILIAAILSLFSKGLRDRLRGGLRSRPALVWLAPPVLTGVFAVAAGLAGAFSLPLIFAMLAYAAAPVACAFVQGTGPPKKPSKLDFLGIVFLWLPLEFGAGAALVPRPAQGFLHSVAYGVAILLGLIVFLLFRGFPGLKYDLPLRAGDYWRPLAAYAALAPVVAILGIWIGFIPPLHASTQSPGAMARAVGLILLGTALPEEILFRSLIQNLLMQKWGESTRTLVIASVIFGCAHLDNGPQPLPNWRYAILATIAGFAYGKVFQKGSSVCSSALLHTMVDWTKHLFF
jgi:membrane protease YdiL (CAAX protease family)